MRLAAYVKGMVIDANIFLELLLDQEKSGDCQQRLEKVQKGEIAATISTFTIDGIILVMEKHGLGVKAIKKFLRSLLGYKGLRIYTSTMNERINAIANMAAGLDFEDALTAQTAIANGVQEIASFDRHFDKLKTVKRIQPSLLPD